MVNFNNILSIIIWLPIIIGLLVLLINNKYLNKFTVLIGIVNFVFSLLLLRNFDILKHSWQFIENYQLIPTLGINYSLGVDGFSVVLIALSCFINLLILIAGFNYNKDNSIISFDSSSRYRACFLIMNGLINGILTSTNALLFYMFFEAMLIPLFLIIGIWGGINRIYAAIKFFLYAFAGSMLFLIAIIYLYKIAINAGIEPIKAFELQNFYLLKLSLKQQVYLFVAFLIAFAIKVPMVPLHTWLPDAHTEAPTSGSVILAAITLKLGAFAMLRFLLPITTEACFLLSKFMIWMSVIAIIYIGFIAVVQSNLKRLIAYSSIAHMGFVTMGMFVGVQLIQVQDINLAIASFNGSLVQMLSHGLISAGLFFSAGVLYDRMQTNKIKEFAGIVSPMPIFAVLFMLFCLANVSLPGTSGFVGELLVILASFKYNMLVATLAATSMILSVSYTLWMYKKVVFGIPNAHINFLSDLNSKETLILGMLALLILLFGVWPAPILDILNNSILDLIKIMEHK